MFRHAERGKRERGKKRRKAKDEPDRFDALVRPFQRQHRPQLPLVLPLSSLLRLELPDQMIERRYNRLFLFHRVLRPRFVRD
jgi:hypothetical protein